MVKGDRVGDRVVAGALVGVIFFDIRRPVYEKWVVWKDGDVRPCPWSDAMMPSKNIERFF